MFNRNISMVPCLFHDVCTLIMLPYVNCFLTFLNIMQLSQSSVSGLFFFFPNISQSIEANSRFPMGKTFQWCGFQRHKLRNSSMFNFPKLPGSQKEKTDKKGYCKDWFLFWFIFLRHAFSCWSWWLNAERHLLHSPQWNLCYF